MEVKIARYAIVRIWPCDYLRGRTWSQDLVSLLALDLVLTGKPVTGFKFPVSGSLPSI